MTLEERVPERVPKMRNTCNLPFMVLGGPTFASAPYCGQHLERSRGSAPGGRTWLNSSSHYNRPRDRPDLRDGAAVRLHRGGADPGHRRVPSEGEGEALARGGA